MKIASFPVFVASLLISASIPSQALSVSQTAELCGEWTGERTGNKVLIRMAPGGIEVTAVTNNPGQTDWARFVRAAEGVYHYAFPNGQKAVAKMEPGGKIRVTNPDGWTDLFARTLQC